jgi:2-dehydro-3-deoxyphosphogluconate aldolase/(4S)-4-hydroxy-2-oxoglutarate aldolase
MLRAWEIGADIIKVFPATALGPGYLKDIRAPLPQLKLMPTGGVTPDNAGEWIRAGAIAVGIGSALTDAKAIAAGDYGRVEAAARRAIANVQAARAPS